MNTESIVLLLCFIFLGGCVNEEEKGNIGYSIVDSKPTNIIVDNELNDSNVKVKIVHYDFVGNRDYSCEMPVSSNSIKTLQLNKYKPELFNFEIDGYSFNSYLFPNYDLKITVDRDGGIHFNSHYSELMKNQFENVGFIEKESVEIDELLKSELPKGWINYFVVRNELIRPYLVYYNLVYNHSQGLADDLVIEQSIEKEYADLLNKYNSSYDQNYYYLLVRFKIYADLIRKGKETRKIDVFRKMYDYFESSNATDVRYFFLTQLIDSELASGKQYDGKETLLDSMIRELPMVYQEYFSKEDKKISSNSSMDSGLIKELIAGISREEPYNKILLKFYFPECPGCKLQLPYEKELMNICEEMSVFYICYSRNPSDCDDYFIANSLVGFHKVLSTNQIEEMRSELLINSAPFYGLFNYENDDFECWDCGGPKDVDYFELYCEDPPK